MSFDIIRREQTMSKVTIRTKQRSWKKTQKLLESLTVKDLRQAAYEEQQHHRISNPAVMELLKLLGQRASPSLVAKSLVSSGIFP